MSVNTEADDHKDAFLDNLDDAIKNLSCIFVDRCWGHDEYRPEYREKLSNAFEELRRIRDDLYSHLY